jgi:hypothetical protein
VLSEFFAVLDGLRVAFEVDPDFVSHRDAILHVEKEFLHRHTSSFKKKESSAAWSVDLHAAMLVRRSSSIELLHGALNETVDVRDVSVIADHIEPVSSVAVDQSDHTHAPFFDIKRERVHVGAKHRPGDLGDIPRSVDCRLIIDGD